MGVTQLRLIMGTSMGCMHAFVWGETYPDFAKALMPLACEPIEIAGLNRMWRQLAIDGIEADPGVEGRQLRRRADERPAGRENPAVRRRRGAALSTRRNIRRARRPALMPSRRVASGIKELDANDLIYQLDSSRNYNPWPNLEKISAPVTWINSADDFINPRNLAVAAAGA